MAKKEFGNVVNEEVVRPVTTRKEKKQEKPVQTGRVKIGLDDSNATKRTFYIRHDVLQQFDIYCATHRIDKGALVNLALKEFMVDNADRTEFDI